MYSNGKTSIRNQTILQRSFSDKHYSELFEEIVFEAKSISKDYKLTLPKT